MPKAHAFEPDVAPASRRGAGRSCRGTRPCSSWTRLRFQAVGLFWPSVNAHPPDRPSVVTAVNWPRAPADVHLLDDLPDRCGHDRGMRDRGLRGRPRPPRWCRPMASTAAVPATARRPGRRDTVRRSSDGRGAPRPGARGRTAYAAVDAVTHGTALMTCVSPRPVSRCPVPPCPVPYCAASGVPLSRDLVGESLVLARQGAPVRSAAWHVPSQAYCEMTGARRRSARPSVRPLSGPIGHCHHGHNPS